jgi:hypothetical protein
MRNVRSTMVANLVESTRLTTKLATKVLVFIIAAFMYELGGMLHFDATLTRTPLPDSLSSFILSAKWRALMRLP